LFGAHAQGGSAGTHSSWERHLLKKVGGGAERIYCDITALSGLSFHKEQIDHIPAIGIEPNFRRALGKVAVWLPGFTSQGIHRTAIETTGRKWIYRPEFR
jgi:hypothetical protein